jgi:hypothetical protein
MLLQFYQRGIGLPLYSVAQQAMFFVSQRGLAASAVGERSHRASLSLPAEHLFDEGLSNLKLFGDFSDRALALLVSGHDSFT